MRNDEKVSVIVPAHNSEATIKRCIESVLNQTYGNIQLIIIGDRCTDKTSAICSRYMKADSRVEYHTISCAGGVSVARNVGLSFADGRWCVFLDSDDWLELNIIEMAVTQFEAGVLNMWGVRCYLSNGNVTTEELIIPKLCRNELVANTIYLHSSSCYYLGNYFRAVWGKFYENSIIQQNKIAFAKELYMGEDAVFLMDYLMHVDRVKLVSQFGYNYDRSSSISATSRWNADLFEQNCLQYGLIKKKISRYSLYGETDIEDALVNFRWWMFTSLIENSKWGLRQRKIRLVHLFDDAVKWMRANEIEMESPLHNSENISAKFRRLYKMRSCLEPFGLCMLYLVEKLMRRLKH